MRWTIRQHVAWLLRFKGELNLVAFFGLYGWTNEPTRALDWAWMPDTFVGDVYL